MKKALVFGICLVVILVLASTSFAAFYEVKKGDTLSGIAKLTGHKVGELVLMNEIKNPDNLTPGQMLRYISQEDKVRAKEWAKLQMSLQGPSGESYQQFAQALRDIENNAIKFSSGEPSGTPFSRVLFFSRTIEQIEKLTREGKHVQIGTGSGVDSAMMGWTENPTPVDNFSGGSSMGTMGLSIGYGKNWP